MNPSNPTYTLSPLSPASLLASLKARSITALKTRIFNFSEELSAHFESSSPDPKKTEADYDQVLETAPTDKQSSEGSSGMSIIPGTQKTVFNEIRRGILIRRRRKANSLFSGEASHVSIPLDNPGSYAENSGSDEDKVVHNCFTLKSSQEQVEIAKFHSGLESFSEQRKNKKVTFAIEEITDSSVKIVPQNLLKVSRITKRAASNERNFNPAFRVAGERLNSDNLKPASRSGVGSSTLGQKSDEILNSKPREIKQIVREAGKAAEITNPRETSPNIKHNDLVSKKGPLTKFPFIASSPTKTPQRSSLPSSPEKTTRKKEASLFDLPKARVNTPNFRELLEGRKALDHHSLNTDARRKSEVGNAKTEKKSRQSHYPNSLVTRNLKYYWDQKALVETHDERKTGFPIQRESKLIIC